ncbi:hypothetical protein GGE16_000799 [Rhizobium leguminosarum]|uniref:Uncharacterized protein n=1 Tax=Rhizobium leguminosarum TaxID=384 RepID=A0AAE2MG31_RHILE|nr:hypothetical protein [Rhizobium leguminosarum]MBB4432747.1 hypothetical protein [Rhizobium esperanzae]MBB4295124.1 hypothetical protein [Rhizobium leguminosarum]MBB4306517.1 hypothetical protein [Rhizobium leguminosarum]MBB4417901.1 hypothetical protein [Rhizobium leguminosarum]
MIERLSVVRRAQPLSRKLESRALPRLPARWARLSLQSRQESHQLKEQQDGSNQGVDGPPESSDGWNKKSVCITRCTLVGCYS